MANEHLNDSLIDDRTRERLLEEVEELRRQLDEAKQTLEAIHSGDVDALIISGAHGEQVYSLEGAERQYRVIVETMNEAAVTVSTEGSILFCNRRFCELMRTPMETVVGQEFISFVTPQQQAQVREHIAGAEARPTLLTLLASDGTRVPVQLCASPLESPEGRSICLVASDLTELEASVRSVRVFREQQLVLEQARADLAERNVELIRSRRAALNLMEDALEARRKAEQVAEALGKSEEQFRAIVSQVTTGVAQTDVTGAFILVNQRYCDITGYTQDELLRMRVQDITHPEDLPRNLEQFMTLVRGGPDFVIEQRCVRKDKAIIWVNNSVAAVRDANGHPRSVVAVVLDITERKRQEAELARRSRQQSLLYELADVVNRAETLAEVYNKALDVITDSLTADRASILLFDDDGVMRFKAWRGLSDAYRRHVEGHSPWTADQRDPRPIILGNVAEAGIAPPLDAIIRQEGIQALSFIPLTCGERLLGKFMVYFDRPYAMTEEEKSLAQAIAGTLAVGIERKTAEARLRESEEHLRTALVAGDMGSWEVDLTNGTVVWDAKQYEIFGRGIGEAPDNMDEFYGLVQTDDVARVKQSTTAAMSIGRFSEEFRIIRPDGGVRWIAGQGAIVADQQNRPVRMVGVNYDITQRRQAEEALRESQEQLRVFAQQLEQLVNERTHELIQSRDQLRALASELNLAEQRERKRIAAELHDYLAQLLVLTKMKLGQGKRLAESVPACAEFIAQSEEALTEALAYTRTLVADLSPPVLHDFGLPAALRWLGEQMERHQLKVTVHLYKDVHPKLPDDQALLLFQSVRELLINCSKHSGTGEATLSLTQQDGGLHIEVRDKGRGFAAAAAAAAAAAESVPLSSQFGLFSIRERMKTLGGTFDIQSSPGNGTTATLVLPLRDTMASSDLQAVISELARKRIDGLQPTGAQDSALPSNAERENSTPSSTRIRVLLVDDHAMVRQGLRSVLESYDDIDIVSEAANGEEAVDQVVEHEPDVVLMDINMPKMNGMEATAIIKARYPATMIIGLSVQVGDEAQRAILRAGATMLLSKEAAVDQLYCAIRDVLKTPAPRGEYSSHISAAPPTS